jgi:hypothetical protein
MFSKFTLIHRLVISCLCLLLLTAGNNSNSAENPATLMEKLQPAPNTPPATQGAKVSVANLPTKVEVDAQAWCDIYLLQDSPRDMLIADQSGKFLQDARQVYIWFQIATHDPVAKIYRWNGIYRPAAAVEENWKVRQIKMIDSTEFMRLVEAGSVPR